MASSSSKAKAFNMNMPSFPPRPEASVDKYNRAHISLGLKWAGKYITHEITSKPFSGWFKIIVKAYEQDCQQAIQTNFSLPPKSSVEHDVVGRIKFFETEFQSIFPLFGASDGLERDENSITELMRWKILARYGDYVSEFWSDIKKKAEEAGSGMMFPGHLSNKLVTQVDSELETERQAWANVHERLEEEKEAWNDRNTVGNPASIAASYTLFQLSKDHGFKFEDMRHCIRMYAERNRKFHGQMSDLLAKGEPGDIAKLLREDWKWAVNFYPTQYNGEKTALLMWLEMKCMLWFQRHPSEEGWWKPTPDFEKMIQFSCPKSAEERKKIGDVKAKHALKKNDKDNAENLFSIMNRDKPLAQFLYSRIFSDNPTGLNARSDLPDEYKSDVQKIWETQQKGLQDLKQTLVRQRKALHEATAELSNPNPNLSKGAKDMQAHLLVEIEKTEAAMAGRLPKTIVDQTKQKTRSWKRILKYKEALGGQQQSLSKALMASAALTAQVMWETELFYAEHGDDAEIPDAKALELASSSSAKASSISSFGTGGLEDLILGQGSKR